MRYLCVAAKPWNRAIYERKLRHFPGEWFFVGSPEDLTIDQVRALAPRYIFFLHWSSKVPADIVHAFECVGFHMSDVPHGRGGSPLQNLIMRGHRHTKLTALRMVEQFDAGPVYLKEDLCLEGAAEEIYMRASEVATGMIGRIVTERIIPVVQEGQPVVFKRRAPEESEIPVALSLEQLYDFIRMLDADGYPAAYFRYGEFRYEFSRAALRCGRIVADVTITPIDGTSA